MLPVIMEAPELDPVGMSPAEALEIELAGRRITVADLPDLTRDDLEANSNKLGPFLTSLYGAEDHRKYRLLSKSAALNMALAWTRFIRRFIRLHQKMRRQGELGQTSVALLRQ